VGRVAASYLRQRFEDGLADDQVEKVIREVGPDPEAEPTLAELLGLSFGRGSVEPVSGEALTLSATGN
jgi:hypothetical protein